MSEWWTYRLSDFLMYTPRSFERLLESYNAWLFPGQAVALAAGAGMVWAAWRGEARTLRMALFVLGASWLWVAWAFFGMRLATIDLAAPYYAYGFVLEGMLLLWVAWRFRNAPVLNSRSQRLGTAIIVFAVFGLPLAAPLLGGSWKAIALFGLTPDATALATLGLGLTLGTTRGLIVIPLIWCALSGALLWNLGQAYALLLPLLGVAACIEVLRARQSPR